MQFFIYIKNISHYIHISEANNKILQYIFSFAFPILLCFLLTLPSFNFAKQSIVLYFMLGIFFSAWNGGFWAGVISTVISGIFISFFFTSPYRLDSFLFIENNSRLLLFLIEGVFVSYVFDKAGRRKEIISYKEKLKKLKNNLEEKSSINEALRKEIRSRDELMSIASHELKTPLTSMLLQTQHALHNIKNVSLAQFSIESLLRMLENVENQTKRLSKMINDFLNISIITTGNLQLEKTEIELNSLVKNVITEFNPRLETEEYELNFFEYDKIIGHWDRTRIEQVLSNVISNAIRYGAGKPIEITVRKRYNTAQILVKDHGIGIPKNKQKKVFDLFERGVTHEEYKGLGIGLFITNEIIKAHGGNIKFSSRENSGSTFIIELPID